MQLKKLLQGGAFALVVAACAIAVPTVAHAEEKAGSIKKAKVDSVEIYGDGTLNASTSAKELLVGVAKVNKSGKATVASWASYEVPGEDAEYPGVVTVDLSKLKSSKENYIAIKGNGAESVAIIKIKATTQKNIKAKFDATTGSIQVGEGTPAAITKRGYYYRTQYSGWQSLWKDEYDEEGDVVEGKGKPASLAMYQEEGAKLYVVAGGYSVGTDGEAGDDYTLEQGSTTVKYDGITDVVVYESKIAPLPSNEAKVTIPAKAKGPKVAVNYLKGTVKIPNNTEWRLVTDEEIKYADDKETPFAVTGEKTVTEILSNLKPATGSANSSTARLYKLSDTPTPTPTPEPEEDEPAPATTLEIRKKQSGKKLASKWTPIEISEAKGFEEGKLEANTEVNCGYNAKEDGTINTDDPIEEGKPDASKYKNGLEVKYGDAGVKDAKLLEGEGKDSVLKIEYVAADKKATKYNLQITNNGKSAYEFVVKPANSEAKSITDSDKVFAAKAGKKVVLKDLTDGQLVFVRTAGDKKTKVWVGAYELLGSIDIPKVVIGTKPEPTKAPEK